MSEINLESLKGMYDRYPEDWETWKKLIEVVDETAEQFGFRQIDPQVLKDNNSGLKRKKVKKS